MRGNPRARVLRCRERERPDRDLPQPRWRGHWTQRVSLIEDPAEPAAPAFFASDFEARLRGHNVAVGLLLSYPAWKAGFVYKAPFWSSYHVNSQRRSSLAPTATFDLRTTRFRLPRSMAGGVARQLGAHWTVAASVTHDQWTNALVDGIPGETGARNFFDELPPQLSTTRDTVSLNLGVERLFLREGSVIPLRLGVAWEPQGPMDPATRDPIEYFLLSGGAGYNTNQFKFDAAVQYRWAGFGVSDTLSVRTAVIGSPMPDAVGRANTREWRVKVSAIYRMPDTEKLRGVLKKIFG